MLVTNKHNSPPPCEELIVFVYLLFSDLKNWLFKELLWIKSEDIIMRKKWWEIRAVALQNRKASQMWNLMHNEPPSWPWPYSTTQVPSSINKEISSQVFTVWSYLYPKAFLLFLYPVRIFHWTLICELRSIFENSLHRK